MENKKIISEEIFRIKEIMGLPINEAKTVGGPWYVRLIDEVVDSLRLAGKSTEANELLLVRNIFSRVGLTQAELDSAIYTLFRRNSSWYPELIAYIKANYASKIDEAVYDLVKMGKKLKDEGVAAEDIKMAMRKYYDAGTSGSYLGDDIANEVITRAEAQVASYVPINPIKKYTMDDADEIYNALKNNPDYEYLFTKYGTQLYAEYISAAQKLIKSQDLTTFVRELDAIMATWMKNHPYVDKSFWGWCRRNLTKLFIARNKAGNADFGLTMLKILGNILVMSWAGRVVVRKSRGQDWGTAIWGAMKDDIVGTLGGFFGLAGETIDELAPPDPIKPGEVEDIKDVL